MFSVMIELEPQVLTHISVCNIYAYTFHNWRSFGLKTENKRPTVQMINFLSSLELQ